VIIKIPRIKELKGTELRRFRKAVAKRITYALAEPPPFSVAPK
jgi:hypothetical protein